MNFEEALAIVDSVLQPERLSDIQELLLCQCWLGKSYYEIATEFDYDPGYLRVVGSRLWKRLSEVFGEKITKNNIHTVLRQRVAIYEQDDRNARKPEALSNQASLTTNRLLVKAEFPGNQVSSNSPFYIQRPPIESWCCSEILQPGALIRIKAPRQMGKTSLLYYILKYANNQGYRTVRLSFLHADEESFANLNNLLRWFCKSITWKLGLEQKLDNYWDEDRGLAKYNCTRYFEEYLLAQLTSPVMLGLDEVERVFTYTEVAQDFLPLLRVWYEEAKESEIWKKLRLVVAHSTEVYLPLNINQSPFEVGLPIVLPEWNPEQVQALARNYRLNWGNSETEQLMAMVGGYPYLVQLAFYHLQNLNLSLEQLLQDAATQTGIYVNHLRYLENLIATAELSDVLRKVVSSNESVLINSLLAYQLQSIGLVKFDGNRVMTRCQLYHQYFRDRLSTSSGGV